MRLILLLPLSLSAAVAIAGCDTQKASERQGAEGKTEVVGGVPGKGLDRSKAGTAAPAAELVDADNDPGTLAQLEGKPLLVNFWATWCAPCIKELPTLEALSARKNGPTVVAVSLDDKPRAEIDQWLTDRKLEELEVWHDPEWAAARTLGVNNLPVSILYDAKGKEVWRYIGDLDWTGPEAAKLLAEAGAAAKG